MGFEPGQPGSGSAPPLLHAAWAPSTEGHIHVPGHAISRRRRTEGVSRRKEPLLFGEHLRVPGSGSTVWAS